MLQRKQTLWLLLTALISLLTILTPYGIEKTTIYTTERSLISKSSDSTITNVPNTSPETNSTVSTKEIDLSAKTDLILMVLSCLCALLAFICIGLFKSRSLQIKLSFILAILCISTAGYVLYDTNFANNNHQLIIGLAGTQLYVGILMPLIAFVFAILAISGIRADEKLVKSMDRLR